MGNAQVVSTVGSKRKFFFLHTLSTNEGPERTFVCYLVRMVFLQTGTNSTYTWLPTYEDIYIHKTFLWQRESNTLQDFPLDRTAKFSIKKYKSYDSKTTLTRTS